MLMVASSRPLRHTQIREIRRLPERKVVAMTMALGFLCPDGVVVGADRRIAGTGVTFAESKCGALGWSNGRAISAYSGARDSWINLRKELWNRFTSSTSLDDGGLRSVLKDSLNAALAEGEEFCTFVGFWIDGDQPRLVKTDGSRIVDVLSSDVIGWGNSALSRYLLQSYETVHYRSVNQAIMYAVNFISQAERYDGQYIGNGMEVYSLQGIRGLGLTQEGRVEVKLLPPNHAEEYQEHIDSMNHWMNVLFGDITDGSRPLKLDQFIEAVERFRLWTSGSEKFTLSGFQR